MADIDLKTETPDATLPSTGFLFGADSQAAASPSVYTRASVTTTVVGNLSSSDSIAWNSDLLLTRKGAANLRLGAADVDGSPVAQTLSVQSTTATTTTNNVAGANLTIQGSQGTGNAAGGSIVFQVAPAGSSGTAQNALATALTIPSDGNSIRIGTVTLTDQSRTQQLSISSGSSTYYFASGSLQIYSSNFAFGASFGGGVDLILGRRAAANLRLGAADAASPVAQTLSAQGVVAGTTNTAGANLTIAGSQGTGTGAGGSIVFQVAPAGASGTAQNALVNALVIESNTVLRLHTALGASSHGISGANGFSIIATGGVPTNALWAVNNGATTQRSDAEFGWSSTTNVALARDTALAREAAGVIVVRGASGAGGSLAFIEQTAPAAPAANGVRIYAVDNGSGKTQLMALFATGAAQQIAIEP
jgi:hypothetical protein